MDPIVRNFLSEKYGFEDETARNPIPYRDDIDLSAPINGEFRDQGGRGDDASMSEASSIQQMQVPDVRAPKTVTPKPSSANQMIAPSLAAASDNRPSPKGDGFDELQMSVRDEIADNQMLRGFSQIGAALAGTKFDGSAFDEANKLARNRISDFQDSRKNRIQKAQEEQLNKKLDPDSDISINVRSAYKKLMPSVADKIEGFERLSAADIEENLAKPFDLYQRAEDRRLQQDLMRDQKQQTFDLKKMEFERKKQKDDEKREKMTDQKLKASERAKQTAGTVLGSIGDVKRILEETKDDWVQPVGGGSVLSALPGTVARDLSEKLGTIKGNIGFDNLVNLKAQGGTLGALSENELKLLTQQWGSLEQGQSREQLIQTINKIEDMFRNIELDANANLSQFETERQMKEINQATGGAGTRSQFPKVVRNADGMQATVQNESELREAMQEGFR